MKLPIFMDNHSTTPMDPRVLEVMLPYFVEKFGNSASRNHAFGWEAEEAVETARKQIARLIHADSKEIVFTSGATESDNLAIKGVVEMYHEKGDHIITSSTEHRAVLDTAKALEAKRGTKITYLPVDKFGMVSPEDVRNAITDKTILISIMFANNEIGTIHPIKEIGKIAKEKGILFHCDATQGVGKVPIDVQDLISSPVRDEDLRFADRMRIDHEARRHRQHVSEQVAIYQPDRQRVARSIRESTYRNTRCVDTHLIEDALEHLVDEHDVRTEPSVANVP